MRRSYQSRKLERHSRKPAELLLVPMIDIFTVLVTFLLMTAVFSRTVILQLNLPASQTEFRDPPPGLQLEVMVRKDLIQVADRSTGPLATLPNTPGGYNYDALTDYLKRVKANLKRYKAAVLKAAVEGKLTEEWRKARRLPRSATPHTWRPTTIR